MKRGFIYKRHDGASWAVSIPDPAAVGGYRRVSGFATKSKALEHLNARRDQIEDVQHGVKSGNMPYKEFFRDYLNYAGHNFSKETHKTYKGILKDFIMFMDCKYPHLQLLGELRVKIFEDYKIWLKDTEHSDNTVNNHVKTLKAILNVAIKQEVIEVNPLRNVGLISVNDEKPIVTLNTPGRFKLFFERCRKMKKEYYPHYYCATKLGLRFGELVTLEWGDVDFEHGVIRISRKESFNPKGRSRKDKKAKERIIPLPSDVSGLLRALPRDHKKVFLRDGKSISLKDKSFRRWIIAIVRGDPTPIN